MKSRWNGEQYWVTCLLVFVLLLILTGMFYPKEVRLIPYVVGFPTLVLLLFLWISAFNPVVKRWVEKAARGQMGGEKKSRKPEKESEFTEWRPVLIVMAWVFPFFILVFLFGYALMSPIFIACFLIRKAGMRWPIAVASAIFSTALIFLLMEGLIDADLWCGAIPEIIPGWLGGAIIPEL
jgi:uncharacterized membrane protein YhaH (DUF805 family)